VIKNMPEIKLFCFNYFNILSPIYAKTFHYFSIVDGPFKMYKCYVLTNEDLEYVQALNGDGFDETMAEAEV
jgi:hypothetical protein